MSVDFQHMTYAEIQWRGRIKNEMEWVTQYLMILEPDMVELDSEINSSSKEVYEGPENLSKQVDNQEKKKIDELYDNYRFLD